MKLIGLTGKKGHGKDTIANHLTDHFTYPGGYAVVRLAMADPIRDALVAMGFEWYRLTQQEYKEVLIPGTNLTPRRLMQTLGTEWGRSLSETFWIDLARTKILKAEAEAKRGGYELVVIVTDIRFDNEAEMIHELNGVIVKVVADWKPDPADGHASEAGVSPELVHVIHHNYKADADGVVAQTENLARSIHAFMHHKWR